LRYIFLISHKQAALRGYNRDVIDFLRGNTPALVLCVLAFFLGGIPFGLLAGKLQGIDLREHGSGNIGATNTLRVLGKVPGGIVLFLDALKGYVPIAIAEYVLRLGPEWRVAAAICAVLGHIYSPYMRFRGGKGVATGLGVIIGLCWWIAVVTLVLFGVSVKISRTVAIGSILATITQCLLFWTTHYFWGEKGQPLSYCIFSTVVGAFILVRHRSNIQRILKGEENKF
jgi:acyl phosphate:glycerol-3-phosphate acyltransferase